MKTLIMTVAVAALMSGTAYAQDSVNNTNTGVNKATMTATNGFTDQSEWVGKTVFDSNMKRVGEVERVSIGTDGQVDNIVVETGGFLDIGGHEIKIAADNYKLITTERKTDIQLDMTSKAFSTMPRFDESKVSDYPLSDNEMSNTKTRADTNIQADTTARTNTELVAKTRSMSVLNGFTDLTEWINRPVYDSNMDRVGEIKRVSFDADGYVDDIIVKTGDFLDMGGHEVMIASDQYMRVAADNRSEKANIQLKMTADRFDAMPHFDKTTGDNTVLSEDAMFSDENNVETKANYETKDRTPGYIGNNANVETNANAKLNADANATRNANAMKSAKGFTDDTKWVGKAVYDSNMERVGEVERVSFGTDGKVDGFIVETDGFLGLGSHEVMIAANQYTLITSEGDEGDTEIQLKMTSEIFYDRSEFDSSTTSASDLPNNRMTNGNNDAEMDVEVDTNSGVNVQ